MAAREFLMIVKESALGTVMSTPVAGTDSIVVRLTDSNAFSMIAEPVVEEIPYGGGFAVTADAVSDHYACKGNLKTKLYPAQAALLLNWAITRINAGQTLPWVTTEIAGDLASCSVYHAVLRSDGTYKRTRYAGTKVDSWQIDVNRQGTTATLTLGLTACQSVGNSMDSTTDPDATEFPAPAETDFPTGPYTFKQTAGLLTVGSVRTQYDSLSIKGTNSLDGHWFESSHLTTLPFCGRATTLDADLYLKATPDDRSAYEAVTAQAASVGFSNGVTGQHVTISFNGKNHITKLPYELPLGKVFMSKLSLKNRWDTSAGTDLTLSFV